MKRENFLTLTFGVGIFALFLLLSSAKLMGCAPFALGFFTALVYSKKNFLVVSPLYVLSNFLVDTSLESLVLSFVPVAVLSVVYFVHYKIGKQVSLLTVNLCAFFSQLPTTLTALFMGETLFSVVVSVLLTQIFTLCATVCLYAVLVRGLKTKLTVDEMICSTVVGVAVCLGLFSVEAFGIKPYYAVCAFIVITMTYSLGAVGLVSAVVFGLGAAFGGDFSALAPIVFGSLGVLGFRTTSPYLSALLYSASCVGLGLYFGDKTSFALPDIIATVIGATLFCSLPKKAKNKLSAYLSAFREPHGDRHIINRNRRQTAEKLGACAKVFWELSGLVMDTAYVMTDEEKIEKMVSAVSREFCENCSKHDYCSSVLDGDTESLIKPIVETAVRRGKATLLELPAFISGSCVKVNELIPLVNRTKEKHVQAYKEKHVANSGKLVFAEQLLGVGELLASMSKETGRIVGFDIGRERVLIDELAYKNVLCTEAVIEERGESVTLVVQDGEARKRAVEKATSKVMRKKMIAKVEKNRIEGFYTLFLTPAPKFDMVFGEATKTKSGEKQSGDSRLVTRPSTDVFIFAIADGMGSGERAQRTSSSAVNLVDSFYRAGFSHGVIINLVNKMLTYTEGDTYNTLDMCICNVRDGKCNFIKMGACAGFLKRGEKVEVIESTALPMGVIREVTPTVVEKTLMDGDIIVLVSDGVTDSLGDDYIISYLEQTYAPNPQELANKIRDLAIKRNRGKKDDDVSVVVGRVF